MSNYYCKILNNPTNPVHEILSAPATPFHTQRISSLSLPIRTSLLLSSLNISIEEQKKSIKEKIMDKWQEEWTVNNNFLKQIQASIQLKPTEYKLQKRRDKVVITRIKIGHTNLTSSHFLLGRNPPVCECGSENTISHLIVECPLLSRSRLDMGIAKDVKSCTSTTDQQIKLLNFLKANNFYLGI